MSQNLLKAHWEPGLSIQDLPIQHLLDLGIKALVLDVDGTLLPRKELILHSSVISWIEKAKINFTLHLLSNNPSKTRISDVAEQLGLSYTYGAAKPRRRYLKQFLEKQKINPNKVAIIGDRVFTDVLVGNRLGLYTVLIRPITADGTACPHFRVQQLEQKIAFWLGAKQQ